MLPLVRQRRKHVSPRRHACRRLGLPLAVLIPVPSLGPRAAQDRWSAARDAIIVVLVLRSVLRRRSGPDKSLDEDLYVTRRRTSA